MSLVRPDSVLNVVNATAPRKETCGLNPVCWDCASHTTPSWMAKSLTSLVVHSNSHSRIVAVFICCYAYIETHLYVHTEWAGCQRISISPDTHRVPYHISFGSKGSSGASRHRSPPDAPGGGSPADLQDFFSRFFQGGAPSDMSANGEFFPTGNPPPHSSGAAAGTSTMFSGSSPQTGFFSPGAQRGDPSSEPWTDGGKPPRRRKKVRKPFQR